MNRLRRLSEPAVELATCMLAILFIPVAFPLLYACVSATGAVLAGIEGAFATFWRSLALAGAYDVVMIASAWGLYEFVLDS